MGIVICSRRGRKRQKCYACNAPATVICDHAKPLPDGMTQADLDGLSEQERLDMTTCRRPCCGMHGGWWTGQKHLCQEHAKIVLDSNEEKR